MLSLLLTDQSLGFKSHASVAELCHLSRMVVDFTACRDRSMRVSLDLEVISSNATADQCRAGFQTRHYALQYGGCSDDP